MPTYVLVWLTALVNPVLYVACNPTYRAVAWYECNDVDADYVNPASELHLAPQIFSSTHSGSGIVFKWNDEIWKNITLLHCYKALPIIL